MKKINLVLIKSPNDNTLVDLALEYPNAFSNEIAAKMAVVKEIDLNFGKGHTLSSPIERGQLRVFESGTDNESPLFPTTLSVSTDGFSFQFDSGNDFIQEVTTELIPVESLNAQRHWCYWDEVSEGVEFLDAERGDDWEDDVYQLVHADSQETAALICMIGC